MAIQSRSTRRVPLTNHRTLWTEARSRIVRACKSLRRKEPPVIPDWFEAGDLVAPSFQKR